MIRPAVKEDADRVVLIYEPIVRETAISFETQPPTEAEMAARILASDAWLVYEDAEALLGYAYAAPFHRRAAYRWSVEVSIYLAEDARGGGVGRQLLGALLDDLRKRGFVNAFGGIALPNPASIRLFESFGFQQIALQKKVGYKLASWHDVGWWQLRLREPSIPPPTLSITGADASGATPRASS